MDNLMRSFSNSWIYHCAHSKKYLVESGDDFYRIIIENTCAWFKLNNGCSICNYTSHSGIHATDVLKDYGEQIIKDLKGLGKKHNKLKMYINGSFFNEDELTFEVSSHFIKKIRDLFGIEVIQVETRPEYVTRDKVIRYIKETGIKFEISFGIESIDETVRNLCLHKGVSLNDFERALDEVRDLCYIKVYLLIKPPFLSENETIKDVLSSVDYFVLKDVDFISCTPVAVQENTILEFLLQENLYRPVWLWTLIEINTQLKNKYGNRFGKKVKISGFDYYPKPLASAFNCERCSSQLLELLKSNSMITWDDIKGFNCNCINIWKKEIYLKNNLTVFERIEQAKHIFNNNIKRSKEIIEKTDSNTTIKYLSDIAKNIPQNKIVLDEVGVCNLSIPLNCNGILTNDALISMSISLDEFHRGIHMSRLVEAATNFGLILHDDLILDTKKLLSDFVHNSFYGHGNVNLKTKVYIDKETPLTHKINLIMIPFEIYVSKYNTGDDISIKVKIPIINACPCTLVTSDELLDRKATHTQRGSITIEFINCCEDFGYIIDIAYHYSSILDILKREDELFIVDNIFSSPYFCEDICRNVILDLKEKMNNKNGEIIVTVITEESIHPHNAFAKKRYKF